MEVLKELVNIVNKNKIKKIDIITNKSGDQKNNLKKLYTGILRNRFHSDEDASRDLYDAGCDDPNFKRLKYRLQERLLNTLFFINIDAGRNEMRLTYAQCYKNWAAIKILISHHARYSAVKLAKRTLTKALKYELTDLAIDITRYLKRHYCTIEGNKRKFLEYDNLLDTQLAIFNAEILAESYYEKLSINYTKSKAAKPELAQEAERYSNELSTYTNQYTSYKLNLFTYLVKLIHHQIRNDYVATAETCDEAIEFFKKKNISSKGVIFTFLIRKLICYIQLGQYELGEQTVETCLEFVPKHSINWFITLEYNLILSFHTQNYQKAYEIFCRATKSHKFNYLYNSSHESWKIYEAYLYFFIKTGDIDTSTIEDKPKKFRLGKFLNEVPISSMDKKGSNISVLIAQLIVLLVDKQYDLLIVKAEAVDKYCYRYLKKDHTYRSNCFIKMLLELPKASFHKQAVIRNTGKYLEKLKTKPLEIGKDANLVEVVPYEQLWPYVLNLLDNRFI